MTSRFILTLTGPSCAGKSHLLRELTEFYPDKFQVLPSLTTRLSRPDDGAEYIYVDEATFQRQREAGELAQWVHFQGVFYATRYCDLEAMFARGVVPVRIVEPSGVDQFEALGQEVNFDVVSVFIHGQTNQLLARWVDRIRAGDRKIPSEYYARRILATLDEETEWDRVRNYDLHLKKPEFTPQLLHALHRLAEGKLTIGMAARLFPNTDRGIYHAPQVA